MGLLKPLASRKVDKMKNMPSREKMEVIRSVMAKELSWPGVNSAGVVVDISLNCSGCWVVCMRQHSDWS